MLDSNPMPGLIDRYLIREIVPYFLLSLLLLTAIIFAQEASRFSELLVVSSRSGLPMQALFGLMAALLPGILIFTLPISLLIGTLVGLGRLSGDSEIVALSAGGVTRTRILKPIVILALSISAVMLYLTFTVLPRSVKQLTDLKANKSLVFQGLNAEIKPRVFEESIPRKVLFVEDIDRSTGVWHNIFLVDLGDDPSEMKIFTAESGALQQGERSEMPELYLREGSAHQASTTHSDANQTENNPRSNQNPTGSGKQKDSDSNDKEKRKNRGQPSYTSERFEEMTVGLEISDERRSEPAAQTETSNQVEEMELAELLAHNPAPEKLLEWQSEVHRRFALPAACLVFALLAVGFGITHVRTGRSFGLLLGLAITVVYYLLALAGQHAAIAGRIPVWLGIWLANIVLAGVGLAIVVTQRSPGSDVLFVVGRVRHIWHRTWPKNKDEEESLSDFSLDPAVDWSKVSRSGNSQGSVSIANDAQIGRRRSLFGLPKPQLIDRLVLSDLVRFFVYILAGFSTLFVIITLFQLLTYITRNNIEWTVVANYLFFLLPLVINNVTPLAALVAVMVTFGLLQKSSQVVALTASGQSIYRLAIPALMGAIFLSAFVFVNQDYILPFTNRRQNNLRHLIRSGQEPPQTFYSSRQWIFGNDSRIYNYGYFDPRNNSFADLNVIDLDRDQFGVARRLTARRAAWDETTREWILSDGWERRFESERVTFFEQFKDRRIALTENPDYFKKDWRGSSSMTLSELSARISDLSRSGFDVIDLKIALQSKIAFPATCLVMVLVALPFSFSVGKRGALFGVAAGIAIGLVFWGALGLFEQMGRYEMLPPILAAWGPNLLFGATGVYLFLNTRT